MNKKLNVEIRTPKREDIPTLLRWGRTAPELQASSEGTWHTKKSLLQWIDNPERNIFLVACVGKNLAGMCFTHHMGDWAYCSFLYVDKKYRKLGIGRKLIDEAQRKMQSHGIDYFSLLVNVNKSGSKKFYEKLGFQKGFNFTWMYRRGRTS